MTKAVMLDSGPLGRIAHPRPNKEIAEWIERLLDSGVAVILPEIADYEVRRNLLLEGLVKPVARLDRLKEVLIYQPLTTEVMIRAAEMWAYARRNGIPTADAKELDGDVILAAQAVQAGAIVATENVGHLSRFVAAQAWRDVSGAS